MHHLNPFWYQNAGPSDPYFANVVGLWHFDETPGSTTYVDSSAYANNMAGTGFGLGDTQTSSAQSVFGGVSLRVASGSLNRANAPNIANYNFGTADFTIEFRFRADTIGLKNIFDMRNAGNGNRFDLYSKADGSLVVYINSLDKLTTAAGSIAATTWYAIAYDRAGTTGRLYVDGAVAGSWTDNTTYDATTQPTVCVTSSVTAGYANVYYDEMRVTNGTARYQGAYTPAAAAFPNF